MLFVRVWWRLFCRLISPVVVYNNSVLVLPESPTGDSVLVQSLPRRNLARYKAYYRFSPVIIDSPPPLQTLSPVTKSIFSYTGIMHNVLFQLRSPHCESSSCEVGNVITSGRIQGGWRRWQMIDLRLLLLLMVMMINKLTFRPRLAAAWRHADWKVFYRWYYGCKNVIVAPKYFPNGFPAVTFSLLEKNSRQAEVWKTHFSYFSSPFSLSLLFLYFSSFHCFFHQEVCSWHPARGLEKCWHCGCSTNNSFHLCSFQFDIHFPAPNSVLLEDIFFDKPILGWRVIAYPLWVSVPRHHCRCSCCWCWW